MKKYLTIAAICIIIAIVGYHFLGPEGGLFGLLGLGGAGFRGDGALKDQAEDLKDEIADLEIKLDEPVGDLNDDEIEDYWNKD